MDSENFILIEHYCEQTQTPIDFIDDLLEYGMIEVQFRIKIVKKPLNNL